jgi:hypothetical protein
VNGYVIPMVSAVYTNMDVFGIIQSAETLHKWTTRSICFTQSNGEQNEKVNCGSFDLSHAVQQHTF